jgi:monovalent cation/hydrogen antiporter
MSGTTLQTTEITLLVLLLSVAAIGVLARKLHTPYSILLVIAGLLFSFFPAMPRVTLNPDVVFFVIWLETKINRFSATC